MTHHTALGPAEGNEWWRVEDGKGGDMAGMEKMLKLRRVM